MKIIKLYVLDEAMLLNTIRKLDPFQKQHELSYDVQDQLAWIREDMHNNNPPQAASVAI